MKLNYTRYISSGLNCQPQSGWDDQHGSKVLLDGLFVGRLCAVDESLISCRD